MRLSRKLSVISLIAFALLVLPLRAGDGSEKKSAKVCPGTMESCLSAMIERLKKAGMIGLDGEWDDTVKGYRIVRFLEGSVAEAAGVKAGDFLVKVNGIALSDEKATKADMENRRPGREVAISILRERRELTFTVTLIPIPADVMAAEIGRHMMEYHAPAAAARQE